MQFLRWFLPRGQVAEHYLKSVVGLPARGILYPQDIHRFRPLCAPVLQLVKDWRHCPVVMFCPGGCSLFAARFQSPEIVFLPGYFFAAGIHIAGKGPGAVFFCRRQAALFQPCPKKDQDEPCEAGRQLQFGKLCACLQVWGGLPLLSGSCQDADIVLLWIQPGQEWAGSGRLSAAFRATG